MEILLVAHIPGYTMVPGNPLSSYRKVVDWVYPPRVGDHVQLGALITPVDEVVFREDGRLEVHFLTYPSLGGIDDLARFALDLQMQGFTGDGDWDKRSHLPPQQRTGRRVADPGRHTQTV
jgi:hypothetical protein